MKDIKEIIYRGLNPAQKEAVEATEGPLLILAGAGSGKTKTMTHRIANLLTSGVSEFDILAVTFTNKAAREMRERLWKILAEIRGVSEEAGSFNGEVLDANEAQIPRGFMPYMGTFHGICVRILRIEYEGAGLEKNFTIYDSDDQLSLVKRTMKNLKIESKTMKPRAILSAISKAKNEGVGPEEFFQHAFYPNQKAIAKVYATYEKEKESANALDFDDLLLRTLRLFTYNENVRKKWQDRFKYVLIDEYQDTNNVQYKLIKLLVNDKHNICVVGDDWQSIYSWRGADFTNILNFNKDFPEAKVIKLEQNYRSTGNILEASQKIINQNKQRSDKKLFTEAGDGDPIEIKTTRDETDEAQFVSRKIIEMSENRPFSDFAVLYRTNAQSYAFEKVFINMRIPYKIVGGVRFYDRREVKDVLAILHLLVNPRDKISFERVTKNVVSGIGEKSLEKIFAHLDNGGRLGDEELTSSLSAKARGSLIRVANFIGQMNQGEESPSEIVELIVKYFDFPTLLDDGTPTGKERINNLVVLADNAGKFESLDEFLSEAALMSSADESSDRNSVTLMTLHAAKGLEFPVVFLVGLEEGLFPSSRAEEEADIEEERRLAYVGMTRAMEDLFLTWAQSRFSFGGRNYTMPSRFLTELGFDPYGSNDYGGGEEDSWGDDDSFEDDFDPFPDEKEFDYGY
ncbi:UvrD-helicase domain-containing protein [Candidatus Saccharibacteria bacterium]|nr:UvrD-helicase domain-containing protein [Candidatus Saccharibacteria bacterium]